jgi:integration host factor subunit alpha
MTKADIVQIIWEKIGFSRKETFDNVDAVFDIIQDTLANGEKVKISDFGNFEVRQKKTRRGRNPQNGEALEISARSLSEKQFL